jgi:hypothetical protein
MKNLKLILVVILVLAGFDSLARATFTPESLVLTVIQK